MAGGVKLGWWLSATMVARPWPSLNMLAALWLGVATFMALGAVSSGLSRTFVATGEPDRVLFFSQGAAWEGASRIDADTVSRILTAPEVQRTGAGEAAGTGEVLGWATLEDAVSGLPMRVPVRGTGHLDLVRREFRITKGRAFEPGRREAIVGGRLARRKTGVRIGDEIEVLNVPWTVVGEFASGDIHESSVVVDALTLQGHMSRGSRSAFANALVRLRASGDAAALIDRFGEDSKTPLNGFRESAYYETLNSRLLHLRAFQFLIGICLLVMVPICVLHVMSNVVEGRKREFGVLKALGFAKGSVFVATLFQVLMLAAAGIALAVATTWLVLHGTEFSVGIDVQTVEVAVHVDAETTWHGVLFGVLVTALGSFAPAWRAAQQTLVTD